MSILNSSTQKFNICSLQSTFRELNLYTSKIDGIFGGGCVKALEALTKKSITSPTSFQAKDVFLTVQKALSEAGYDTKGVDGAWGKNSQTAFDSSADTYRKENGIKPYYYAWSGHKAIPSEAYPKIEAWLTKWGKPLTHVSFLLSCMAFETAGTFNPAVRNGKTKATGLIQFMPATAIDLGTTIDLLAKMSFVDQLDYVFKYFEKYQYIVKCKTVEDYYLSIFYPARVGKSPDEILGKRGSALYNQNKVFDKENKGYYTIGDICESIITRYWEGMMPANRLQIK